MAMPRTELVAFSKTLRKLCEVMHRPAPVYVTNLKNSKYTATVTVDDQEPVEGSCSEFVLEAKGKAAKAWLAKHQPGWKKILDSKPSSSAFSDDEVEMPSRSEAFQKEEEIKLTPPSSPHSEAHESSSKAKEKVRATEKASIKSGGLAALDSMSKNEAFTSSESCTEYSPKTLFGCDILKRNKSAEWLSKGSAKTGVNRGKEKARSGERGVKEKAEKRKVKVDEGEGSNKIHEMLRSKVESIKEERESTKSKAAYEHTSKKGLLKDVFGSTSSTEEVEEVEQWTRGEKRKKGPSEEKFSNESFHRKSSSEEKSSEKKKGAKLKSEDEAGEESCAIGGKISPVKSVGKSRKLFDNFGSNQNGKAEPSKSSFSFTSKPLKESSKCNVDHRTGANGDSNGSEGKLLKKAKKGDAKETKPKERDRSAFKFSSVDKRLKEDQVKKTGKKESKSGPSSKKVKMEKSLSPCQESETASGSSVFDHEDDPEVMEIVAKQRQEARALSRRSRGGSRGSQSLARMAERQMCQSEGASSRTKRKLSQSKAKKEDKSQPTIGKFFVASKNKASKETKEGVGEDDQDDDEASEIDPDYFTPNIDDLLKLPERPDDGSKTQEEILDELDVEIAKRHKRHELDRAKVDKQIEEERKKKEERKARCKENAKLRNRLERELSEEKVRGTFRAIIPFLEAIWNGRETSKRHEAFHKSVRTRQALYYTMITDPFTDDQLDWVLEEMSTIWMRNKREQMENNEYIWKVLLPECFIKMYGDYFGFSKEEAEVRISETPLHKKDRAKLGMGGEEERDGDFSQTQGEI